MAPETIGFLDPPSRTTSGIRSALERDAVAVDRAGVPVCNGDRDDARHRVHRPATGRFRSSPKPVRLGRPIVAALARVERGGLSATARLNCASTQGHKIRIAVSVCPVRVPRRRRVGPLRGGHTAQRTPVPTRART